MGANVWTFRRGCAAGMAAAALLALSACGGDAPATNGPDGPDAGTAATGTATTGTGQAAALPALVPGADPLAWAIDGPWRTDEAKARDGARNPAETLEFFEIEPDDVVIELWPGGGWYSDILAPYLATGGGTLIAATFDPDAFDGDRRARIEQMVADYEVAYSANPAIFGTVTIAALSDQSGPLAPGGTADAVLTFRNLHNWMTAGYLDKVFADAYAALKPGGVFGVVEHRLPSSDAQDPVAATGYVHEDYVKAAAARAGFVFEASSEINANPADTADHPFGVWTLPPNSRTEDRDGNSPENFDPAIYLAIGESDRMTLKFRKPEAVNDVD